MRHPVIHASFSGYVAIIAFPIALLFEERFHLSLKLGGIIDHLASAISDDVIRALRWPLDLARPVASESGVFASAGLFGAELIESS